MEEKKRLTRSNNKMIGGVCAGLAEYLDIDPTIVRIDRMGIDGSFRRIRYTALHYIMVNNA